MAKSYYIDYSVGEEISIKYGLPRKYVSCPGCGYEYGHHKTKVDVNSQECSTCCKKQKYKDVNLIDAEEFVSKYLDL